MTPSSTLSHPLGGRAFEMEEQLRQANHLVNPSSGIANDFLNQYNVILLLVENLPDPPARNDRGASRMEAAHL